MESNGKVKIGYSKDCISRLKQFKTGNPDIVLVDTKPGTLKDESNLHKLCQKWHVTNEWFEKNEDVLQIWNNYDPWKGDAFKQLRESVEYYSSIGFWKIIHPSIYLFEIKNLMYFKELIRESDIVPKEILKYIKWAENLMDVYYIILWFKNPLFDLPENTIWKLTYDLSDTFVFEMPYDNLLCEAMLKIRMKTKNVQKSHEFTSKLMSVLQNNSTTTNLKELVSDSLNKDEAQIQDIERWIDRINKAEKLVEKLKNEVQWKNDTD